MALIFDVKVIPSSGKKGCLIDKAGQLKCYLHSAPERGKANNELIKNLSQALNVTQNKIEIVGGKQDRKKRIKIETNLSYDQLLTALGIEQQINMFTK